MCVYTRGQHTDKCQVVDIAKEYKADTQNSNETECKRWIKSIHALEEERHSIARRSFA